MIFRTISYQIAAQFTAFVFALLLITGSIFFAGDVINRNRLSISRLERQIHSITDRPNLPSDGAPSVPPFQRERIRIADASGNVLFSGAFFEGVPFQPSMTMFSVSNDDDTYDVLTAPFMQNGQVIGYVQVADRALPNDLIFRILLFLLISAGISVLTFGVGLFFARRSLKPAQDMMDRLEQFTQDASHELRTPLTAVSTSLEMALLKENSKDYVRAAKNDLNHVFTLVERLLELAQLDRFILQTESVNFSALTQDVIEKHQAFAQEKNITITHAIAPSVMVDGDPALLRQAVSNLLSNAIKFNHDKGTVTVSLTKDVLTISDTGKGISEDALPHIFNRFYQEDTSRTASTHGMGLGLALVKRIIDLHGWTIDVVSTPKKGTAFTLGLSHKKHAPKL